MVRVGDVRGVALVATVSIVAFVSIQRVASRVFALNFSVAGPNATVLLVLGLLTVWTVPVARRLGWSRSLHASAAVVPFAVLASAASNPVLAGAGAVLALSCVTPWLVALGARDRAFVPGLAAGVAGVAALRGWLGTLPASASLGGIALVVGVAFVAAALALQRDVPQSESGTPVVSAVAWLAVVAQGVFLAFPAATAVWGAGTYTSTVIATVAGVVVGAVWTTVPRRLDARGTGVVAVAYAIALADVVWVAQLGAVAVFLAQVAFVRVVAEGLADDGWRRLGVAQAVALFALVVQVLAANWSYVPGGRVLAGHAPLALYVLALAPAVAVVAIAAFNRRTDVVSPRRLPSPTRRDALTAIAPAALAGLSLLPDALADGSTRSGGSGDATRSGGSGDATSTSASDGTGARAGGPPYRVLTLNVHQWLDAEQGSHNYRGVRDVLERETPHVVGLQETEGGRYTTGSANAIRWLANELDYHYAYGPATKRGGYGVSILSTYPILDVDVVSLPVHQSPPRWAVFATVDAPDGELTVVSTHFQTGIPADDRRLAEARTITSRLATSISDRAILLGDFNVEPDRHPAYDHLREAYVDAWTAAGNDRLAAGGTWPAGDPGQRIDYVWLDGDWTVDACTRVGDPSVSDHLGVLATVDPADDARNGTDGRGE